MKKSTKKLVLKKTTVQLLENKDRVTMYGGSRRVCSVTACLNTDGCCQPTK